MTLSHTESLLTSLHPDLVDLHFLQKVSLRTNCNLPLHSFFPSPWVGPCQEGRELELFDANEASVQDSKLMVKSPVWDFPREPR